MASDSNGSTFWCSHFSTFYFEIAGNNSAPYLVNFWLNFATCLVGALGNALVLFAIRKITSLHRPSKLLLSNLVLADIVMCSLSQPSYMAYLYTKVTRGPSSVSCWSANVANVSVTTLACVSFMTLAVISVDRYVATFYSTRYRRVINTKRVAVVLVVIWTASFVWGTSWHWCFACHYPIALAIMGICMPLSSFCYMKIFLKLRRQQKQRENQLGNARSDRYRSTSIGLVTVYVLMLVLYTPFLCLVLLIEGDGTSIERLLILEYASTLSFFSSAFNPFVYCWRIRDVKLVILDCARKVLPCLGTGPSDRAAPSRSMQPSTSKAQRKVAPAFYKKTSTNRIGVAIETKKATRVVETKEGQEDITTIDLNE